MSIISDLKTYTESILDIRIAIVAWAIVVLVLLVVIFLRGTEKFRGEFTSAPIASQLPPELLGLGAGARASVEFSSTNQGGSNIHAENLRREHMTGSMEAPRVNSIDGALNENQQATVRTEEAFSNRAMFQEGFTNPENYLNNVLHGN